MRNKFTFLFLTVALLLAVAGTTLALVGDPSGTTSDPSGTTSLSPTITSDQADYPPGATVTLTGSNWQPGESVHINVNDDLGQTWSYDSNPDVQADANGDISHSFQLPDWFVATYKVTATGDASGVATHTFTDAIQTTTTLTSDKSTSNIGENVKFDATVTCNPKKSGDQCDFTGTSVDLVQDASGNNCNGTVLASASVSGGTGLVRQATINYAFSSSGSKSVSACFRGGGQDPNAAASQSDPLTQNVNAGAAAKLVFPQQPTNEAVDAPITPAPAVQVQDAFGTPVTSSNASVTVALASGSPPGTLSGTKTVNAVNGVATFNDLSIDTVNTNYRLTATSGTLTSATSNAFNTTRRTTSTSLSCSPSTVGITAPGNTSTCTATVTDTDTGTKSAPTGTVSWTTSSGSSFGTTSPCNLSAGSGASSTCSATVTVTSQGGKTISASYNNTGDTKHATSNSGGVSNAVTGNNSPNTTLTVNPASGTFGGTVDLTATLKNAASPNAGISGKTITFKLNGNAVCGASGLPGCPTTSSTAGQVGQATLNNVSLSGIAEGTYPNGVSAAFAGDGSANASTGSNTLTVTPSNQAPSKPGTPSTSSNPNNGEFTLNWTASTDDGKPNPPGAVTYTLQHKNSASGANFTNVATGLNNSSYTFGPTSKETEGTWTYQVIATDSALSSTTSDASSAIKVDRSGPNAPTLSFNTSASQSLKVTVGGVDWYKDSALIDVADNGDKTLADGSAGSGVKAASLLPNPFSVTTNGTSTASRTVEDNVGNVSSPSAPLSVHVDANAPTSSFGSASTADGPYSAGTYANKNVTVTLNANDGESGVEKIVYSTNGGTSYQDYPSGGIVVSQEGTTQIDFHAVDKVGHVESDNHYTVKIDKTAIASKASANRYSNSSPITVHYDTTNASADLSGLKKVELWVKGPNDTNYSHSQVDEKTTASGDFSYAVTQDGDYSFYTIAEDNAGNREVQPPAADAIVTVTHDTQAPTTTASATNADNTDYTFGTFTKQNVTVTLSADDGTGSGVDVTKYTTDGSTPSATNGTTYSGAFTISSEGTTTVKFLSIDKAGNPEAVQSKDVKIDKTAIASKASANRYSNSSPITVNYTTTNASADFSGLKKVELWAKAPGESSYTMVDDSKTTASGSFSYNATQGDGDYSFYTISEDNAGNREVQPPAADAIVTVTYDTAAPTLTVGHTADGNNGWNKTSPVTLNVSASDSGSGLAADPTCTDGSNSLTLTGSAGNWTASVSGDGTHNISCSVSDKATNPANANDTVKIDTQAVPSQASANRYSNSSPITVNYTTTNAASDTSGLVKVELWAKGPQDANFSKVDEKTTASGSFSYTVNQGDGDYSFYTISEDNAGNREVQPPSPDAIVTVTHDTAAPTLTVGHTADGNNGWNKTSPVTLNVSASDSGSDLNGAPACKDGTTDLTLTAGTTAGNWTASLSGDGTHNITCSVSDKAGNPSGDKIDTVKIDTINPTVGTATADKLDSSGNPSGSYTKDTWTNQDVKVSWTCSDGGSGPVNANGSQTVSSEGASGSVTPSCEDQAGHSASGPAFSPIKIDKTKPTATFVGIASTTYPVANLPAQSAISCSAADTLSGPANCVVDFTGYSNSFGSHTLTAAATDQAGNTNTATLTYIVGLKASSILSPVDSPNRAVPTATNLDAFKIKSTIPVKFKLYNDTAMTQLMTSPPAGSVAKISFFQYDKTTDSNQALEALPTGNANTDNIFRWTGSPDNQYIYNLATTGKTAGTYGVQLTLYASDGTTVLAQSEKDYFVLRS